MSCAAGAGKKLVVLQLPCPVPNAGCSCAGSTGAAAEAG